MNISDFEKVQYDCFNLFHCDFSNETTFFDLRKEGSDI